MRCCLCDAQRATYPLVFVSKELKVALELRGVEAKRACESCWMAETIKMPQEDMLWALAEALTDTEMVEKRHNDLEEKYDDLKKEFKDLETDSERKIDEDDHEKVVEAARREGHVEGHTEGYDKGYDVGYEEGQSDAETEQEEAAADRRVRAEELP